MEQERMMVAFIFDSGKLDSDFYGEVVCFADKALWKKHVAEVDSLIANPVLLEADMTENTDCE